MRWLCARRRSPIRVGRTMSSRRAPQVALDRLGELARVDGLLQEPVAADGEARVAIPFGGDGHDGHAGERGLAAQPQGDLVAVEPGHVEVDQHQIGPLARSRGCTPSRPSAASITSCPAVCEELADEEPVAGIVFDVEDARHGSFESVRLFTRFAAWLP